MNCAYHQIAAYLINFSVNFFSLSSGYASVRLTVIAKTEYPGFTQHTRTKYYPPQPISMIMMKKRCLSRLIRRSILIGMALAALQVTALADTSELKIAIKQFPPLVFKDELKGFCIDMVNTICAKHNLSPKFIRYDSVPAILKAVESGECDLAFSGITITAEREKRVDFSYPFFDSGLLIAVRTQPGSQVADVVRLLLKVIGLSMVVFFIGLTVVAHCIWLVEKDDTDAHSFPSAYRKGISDAYWWAVVTMTTVGYGDKCPKKIAGRMIAAVWMLIGIIWFAGFTATLSSALTVDRIKHGEIQGLADLENKRVAVIKGTTSEEFVRLYNVKTSLVASFDDLTASLKEGKVEAIIYDAPALMYLAKVDPSIKVVGDLFDEQQYGVVFPENRNEKYKEIFNIDIISMKKNGEFQKIYDKWF